MSVDVESMQILCSLAGHQYNMEFLRNKLIVLAL